MKPKSLKCPTKPDWFLAAAFLIFFIPGALAQGYYHIRYQMYGYKNSQKVFFGPEYEALLIDYGNTENVMRVRYQDNGAYKIVEQNISSYEESITDTNGNTADIWVYKGYNVKAITAGAEDYYPDIMVLKKNNLDKYYFPDYVYSYMQDSVYFGDITTFRALNTNEITNDFLGRFNWEWSEENSAGYDLSNTTMHLILVSNTNDINLSGGFLKNHQKLSSLFSEATEAAGIRMSLIELKDNDFNKETLNSRIRSLSVGQDDIILFYFSGHGFRYNGQASLWPQMALTSRISVNLNDHTLNLEDIYNQLITKGARLTLVFGECCNAQIGVQTPVAPDYPQIAPGGLPFNRESLYQLFSRRGSLLLATSGPNEFSMYYPTLGGYFCTSFYEAFLRQTGVLTAGQVTWDNLIGSAVRNTARTSQGDADTHNTQTPISIINIR